MPADLLEPSVVSAHLAVCDQHGSVVKVVDRGKLLVLEAVAAAEVQSLFHKTAKQVQQLVCSTSIPAPVPAAASASSASSMQHRRTLFNGLLTRFGGKRHGPSGGVGADGAGSSSASQQPQQPQQGIKPPDAATLYAYEHFFVPLVCQWEVALTHGDAGASSSRSGPVGLEPADEILQLFSLLLEHELWACCLELLGRYPVLAAQARRPAQKQEDGAQEHAPDPGLSSWLRGLQPAPASTRSTGAPPSAQLPREAPQPRPALAVERQQQQQQLLLEQQQEYEMLCQQQQQQQMLLQQQQQQHHHHQQQMLLQQQQLQQMLSYQQSQQHEQAVWLQQQHQRQHMLQQLAAPMQMHHQQASALLQQHMLLQQQQLGLGSPVMLGSVSPSVMQAAAAQPQALSLRAGTLSPTGSDETVESASEILIRLGLLQQARGEQEALQHLAMLELHQHPQEPQEQQPDTQQLSSYSLSAFSASWSVPLPVVQPPMRLRPDGNATKSAPLCAVPAPTSLAAVAPAAAGTGGCAQHASAGGCAGVDAAAVVSDHSLLAAHDHAGVASEGGAQLQEQPAAQAAGCRDACPAGSDLPAAAAGLRQRRPAPTGSLFSKQRKLSWEEEQPEPLPVAPPLPTLHAQPGATAAAGWYPGSWQLPEPSHAGLMFGAGGGGFPLAQGFGAAPAVQPRQPADPTTAARAAAVAAATAGQVCGLGALAGYVGEDPYTEPSYAAAAADVAAVRHRELEQQQAGVQPQGGQQPLLQQQRATVDVGCQVDLQHADTEEVGEAQDEHPACPGHSKETAGLAGTCHAGSSSAAPGCSSDVVPHPLARLSWQQPWQLVRLCASGFQDPCLEASYLVFKNHACSLLDATAGFLCTAMLVAASLRSLGLQTHGSVWLQFTTMAIYSALFFLPYIAMKLRLHVFLRLREQLLVWGRNGAAVVLAVMAAGYLPMVQVWRNMVVNTLSLQVQNGFILPACQQVRLPAALMIAAVHVPADAIFLAAARPFQAALLHSVLMHASSVCVALVLDAWCRMRFVQRYSGMTSVPGGQQRQPAALLHAAQQS